MRECESFLVNCGKSSPLNSIAGEIFLYTTSVFLIYLPKTGKLVTDEFTRNRLSPFFNFYARLLEFTCAASEVGTCVLPQDAHRIACNGTLSSICERSYRPLHSPTRMDIRFGLRHILWFLLFLPGERLPSWGFHDSISRRKSPARHIGWFS